MKQHLEFTDDLVRVGLAVSVAVGMEEYLRSSEIINWQHPEIITLVKRIASAHKS